MIKNSQTSLLISIFLLIQFNEIHACGSSGCCARSPPPLIAPCGSGCEPGYRCGPYGCMRARTLAALTKRIDGVLVDADNAEQAANLAHEMVPHGSGIVGSNKNASSHANATIVQLANPSWVFRACCAARGLPDACVDYCNFKDYTTDALEQMFLRQDKCPLEAANEIHYCAAQGLDHSSCCAVSGVGTTIAGDKCVRLCDQRPNRFTRLDFSYIPCASTFETMKRCFYVEVKRRAYMKFGTPQEKLMARELGKRFKSRKTILSFAPTKWSEEVNREN